MQPFGEAAWETNIENLKASKWRLARDDHSHHDEHADGNAFPPTCSASGRHCAPDGLPPIIV